MRDAGRGDDMVDAAEHPGDGHRPPADLRLGEVLARTGAVAPPDLERALAIQRAERRPLGDILVGAGVITREALADAQAHSWGVARARFDGPVDAAVRALLDTAAQRRYGAVPLAVDAEGVVTLAMTDPTDIMRLDDLRLLLDHEVRPVLATPAEIDAAITQVDPHHDNFLSGLVREAAPAPDAAPEDDTLGGLGPDAAPVVRMVGSVLSRAVEEGASDVHLEPQSGELIVRYRVDGVLRTVATVPSTLAREVVSRIKIMGEMDIAERRLPQDGRLSLTVADHRLDLRVVSVPTVHGEGVVIRILDKSNVMLELAELGLSRQTLERFTRSFRRPYGAVLVSGPTGSGKSTTLYGALNQLNTDDRKIITVEDPVEYRLAGINQMQVNAKAGLTFASGLRALLRCDPDILMIGEVRDHETAQIAMEAALTGHLVLATIHTNDAASALTRLTEMGVEPFLSASGVVGVLAQRLVRRLCTNCRRRDHVAAADLMALAATATLPPGVSDPVPVHAATGCAECRGTGYRGRIGIYEMLEMTEELERLTAASAPSTEIRRQARRDGMRPMAEDGVLKVLAGQTTLDELARMVA